MYIMLAGSVLAKVATPAFAAVPNASAVFPAVKTLSSWALGYVLVSLSLALLWVVLVSAGQFYQRYVQIASRMRFSESPRTVIGAALREEWWRKDQDLFMRYLEGTGGKEREGVGFSEPCPLVNK